MNILYIPFTVDEAIFDLFPKAIKWCAEYEKNDREVPIIIHHQSSIPFEIQEKLIAGDCTIYIISHGIDKPELVVSNQTNFDDDYIEIPIELIAKRFTQDLIIPGFSNDNIVKLYFCDEFAQDNKARRMAKQFRNHLDKAQKPMEVKYYTNVIIGGPGTGDNKFGAKAALKSLCIKNNLFVFELTCLAGNAKSFRRGLNEPKKTSIHFFSPSSSINHSKPLAKFSHLILTQLADSLIKIILQDKTLRKNQEAIVNEIFDLLPKQLADYLVDSLTITGKNFILKLQMNKPMFQAYLVQEGIILLNNENQVSRTIPKSNNNRIASAWVDEDDYLDVTEGLAVSEFTEVDNQSTIFSLTDFSEIFSDVTQEEISKKAL